MSRIVNDRASKRIDPFAPDGAGIVGADAGYGLIVEKLEEGEEEGKKARTSEGRGRVGSGEKREGCVSVVERDQQQQLCMGDALSQMPLVLQQPERGEEEMDPRLWQGLPDELQDRVLACLPVPLLLQLRLVCRRWKEVISSPAFSKLRREMPYGGPHFLVFEFFEPESSAAYDPWLQKWYVCLSQIPLPITREITGEVISPLISVCADGGLLCVVCRRSLCLDLDSVRILVCNPVTRTYKELPKTWVHTQLAARRQHWNPILVALVVDRGSNSFRVVTAGRRHCSHTYWSPHTCYCRLTEVYDSNTDRWEVAGELPWVNNEFSYHSRLHAVCGENLYCVGFCNDGDDVMMTYNLNRREWSKSQVLMPPLHGEHVLLFERRGALMLVQRAARYRGLPALYSWVPASGEWHEEKTYMPRNGSKFKQLLQSDEDLFWVGQGDQLFFISPNWDQAMMYNISSRSWTITPHTKFIRGHGRSILPLSFDFNLQTPNSDSSSAQGWLKY
ncbi:hypothetical protein R1flu_026327 [Riccia fluitans]|uniref:F-box domain-containing protein n=1 Tax=Riccia fluitans TaxID=41844 RepID=A0ABD1XG80_9MARC